MDELIQGLESVHQITGDLHVYIHMLVVIFKCLSGGLLQPIYLLGMSYSEQWNINILITSTYKTHQWVKNIWEIT